MTHRPTATIERVEKKGAKPGEIWSVTFVCTACQTGVGNSDSYCRHCGARFLGVKA